MCMALFGRKRGSSTRREARDDLAALREWAESRRGIEAYVEPRTTVSEPTVVLVDAEGESMRRRVPSTKAVADFARKAGIPVYDTNRVGYPQRMREYAVRQKQRSSQQPPRGRAASGGAYSSTPRSEATPAERPLSPSEREAIATLQVSADVEGVSGRPDDETLQQWWKRARARSHPDRRGGDRTEWDEVEQAARTLGLL